MTLERQRVVAAPALRGKDAATAYRSSHANNLSLRMAVALVGAAIGMLLSLPTSAAARQALPDMQSAVVDSVLVVGNVRQPGSLIMVESNLRSGQTITYRDIQQGIKRLMGTGQYDDVKVYARYANNAADGPVVLVIEVVERPLVSLIEFNGLEHVRGSTIRDSAGLQTRVPLRPSRVVAAEQLIRDMLAERGFTVREVSHRLEEIPGQPGEYRLVFDVREGTRVALAEIEFRGNQAFTSSQLWDAMKTKKEGFLWYRSGVFDQDTLVKDLRQRLPEFYGQAGYIDFMVVNDTLIVDPESGKARLVIEVDEGPQYKLAEFNVTGNSRFPTDELREYFEQRRGGLLATLGLAGSTVDEDVFDQKAFTDATRQVQQLYRNQGYLYAQISENIERITLDDGTPAVRATWQIQEGPRATIKRVAIVGNTRTHDSVIRDRIFIIPGDYYNEDLLIQSYQSISGLGFFETPLPMPRIEQTPEGDVNVTFEVVEKQTGSINFGTAIGGGTGISGFLGYDEPNLFGQAKAGSLRWEFGRWTNNFEASYSDPAIRNSRISGAISVFRARDRYFQFSEGQRRRTGAGIRFGFPLPVSDFRTRLNVGYTIARTDYEQFTDDETSLFAQPPGLQSTLSVGVMRNTLNNPIFPTVGVHHEVSAAFTGGPLGGDGTFQKYTAMGSWWVPVGELGGSSAGGRPARMAIGLSVEGGVIFGDEASLERFPFERFWMGGIQFGRPLRGYDETTVTPRGYIPRDLPGVPLEDRFGDAYLRLSAEYAIRVNDQISTSVFYDAGGIWQKPSHIDPTRLLRGAGVGVMLITPFGPLGLDYAYGFDKDRPGWQLHFRFGQGY